VPGPEENNPLDVQSSTSTTAIIDHGWKPDALPLRSIMAANDLFTGLASLQDTIVRMFDILLRTQFFAPL
jgi:hypothetical protein